MRSAKIINNLVVLGLVSILLAGSCRPLHNATEGSDAYSDITYTLPPDTLFRIAGEEWYEYGIPCGYVNQHGDTVIPFGKYSHCFTDTLIHFGVVVENGAAVSEPIGIDQQGNRLFEVYWFDNGPDYAKEGLFRVLRNGKIGYADLAGKIIIQPQFACALPFENARARVAYHCEKQANGEHTRWVSDSWFYIDKAGNKIE